MRHTVRSVFCLFAALLALAPLTALAQTTSFDLPAQSLSESLKALGAQANVNVMVAPSLVDGKRAQALKASLSVSDALARLLNGTGLEYHFINDQTVVVRAKTSSASNSDPAPAGVAPHAGDEPSKEGKKDSSQDFRVAQVDQTAAGPQVGQKTDEERKYVLQEVVVTGTHIHDVAPITPVTTITHDEIVREGYTTLAEVIEQLPQNFLGGASPASNPISSFGGTAAAYNLTFAASINLRGLGPNATLVLLDGRRVAPASYAGVVDISNIPVSIIDRVEILTDGASSVYGADAVAGVVNIITRREFSGVQVQAGVTGISEGKTPDHNANVLTGFSWSGGGLVASADYEKDNPLYAHNRYFAANLADPWALTPQNEKMNLYASGHHDFSDALTLSGDAFVTRRNFSATANLYGSFGFPGLPPGIYSGRSDLYSASLQLDYRISSDWTATLIGQVSKDQDRTFTYSPAIAGLYPAQGSETPGFYRVRSLESRIDGKLFDMPGGAVRIAVGAQFLQESFEAKFYHGTPSDPTVDGIYQQSSDSRHVSSAYGELSIPLIGKDNGVPLARGLRINVSARYDDYSDFGRTSNPRFALEWEPAADLKLHATYSRSFQVPTFVELTNVRAAFVEPMSDPKSVAGSTLVVETVGGSPSLQPETAKSLNLGVTYEPKAITGLKIDASYFHIKFDNRIIQIHDFGFDTNSLQEEAILGPTLVERNPTLGQITQALDVPSGQLFNWAAGNFTPAPYVPSDIKAIVDGAYVNSGSDIVAGEDFDVRYKAPETRVGTFLVDVDASYFNKYDFKLSSSAPATSFLNTTLNPLRFRAKANVGWSQSAWGANARINFANRYNNTIVDPNCAVTRSCSISSWTTVDLNAYYAPLTGTSPWLEDSRVTFLVTNVFNRAPPSVTGLSPNQGYDPLNANPLMRTFGVTFTKRFGGNKAQ